MTFYTLCKALEKWIEGGEAVFHRSRYQIHSKKKGTCSL
jgi:hypothetical protein